VNLASATVDAIAEKLQVTDTKPSIGSVFMKPAPQRPARTSTLDMTSVFGLRSSGSSITLSPEELTSLFDAAQTEVLRLMEKDSWVRYLQSPQFAVYAREHVRSAHQFADTIEKKILALPVSSVSTISASSRSSETKPSTGEKEKRSRGEPENLDRSSAGSTGEKLRCSTGEKLRSATEKIPAPEASKAPPSAAVSDDSDERKMCASLEILKSRSPPENPMAYVELV